MTNDKFGNEPPKGDQWPSVEHSVSIPIDAPSAERYRELCEVTRKVVAQNLIKQIYAPSIFDDMILHQRTPTWRETFSIYRSRIRDAWSVLLGREHIGADW